MSETAHPAPQLHISGNLNPQQQCCKNFSSLSSHLLCRNAALCLCFRTTKLCSSCTGWVQGTGWWVDGAAMSSAWWPRAICLLEERWNACVSESYYVSNWNKSCSHTGLSPSPDCVRFRVDTVALWQVFLKVLQFPCLCCSVDWQVWRMGVHHVSHTCPELMGWWTIYVGCN
jgi:hypothetical protein